MGENQINIDEKRIFAEQRRAEIAGLIERDGSVDVASLAGRFSTSRETIRKDLTDLERQGILKRTHGGAVLESRFREFPVFFRGVRQVEEKKWLCKKAASSLHDGDTLFIDNSSTMLYLPQYIPEQLRITILTNSVNFLLEASRIPNRSWNMICLGGFFNPGNLSVHGAGTMKLAQEYYPSKALFSCTGISPQSKITDNSHYEIEVKRMMIERAQETFLLADQTKLNKSGQIYLCELEDIDHLISTTQDGIDYLRQKNVDIILAD